MLIKASPGLVFFFWIATRGKIMKRILLTTTSLVLAAGVAQAESALTWSGTGVAGVAREGSAAAIVTTPALVANSTTLWGAAKADTNDTKSGSTVNTNSITTQAEYETVLLGEVLVLLQDNDDYVTTTVAGTTLAALRTAIALLRTEYGKNKIGTELDVVADLKNVAIAESMLDLYYGNAAVAKAKAGDFATYGEVNATVVGSVTAGDLTMTAAMSVDAGKGYNFADDEGFDAAKTNGVALDYVKLDMGAMGALTFDEGDVAHLVDGDDETNADILYTNTFGSISASVAMDVTKDTDLTATAGTAATMAWTVGTDGTTGSVVGVSGSTTYTAATAAVGVDVAWSAKATMPVGNGTANIAMDEEGGNAFGVSQTFSGVVVSFDSKLEALEEELSKDRSNTIALSYAVGATTLGASWNSVEDGDQWGISAAYAADGIGFSASTDEGSDWAVSGSYLIGTGASVVGGVNYSEDAYLGLSFAF